MGLRHPLLAAKQYAALDHQSGGRLTLGVGAGNVPEEFEPLGADFARRGPVIDATIDAQRAAQFARPDQIPDVRPVPGGRQIPGPCPFPGGN